MSLARVAPRKGFERFLAIISAFAVFMSLMVVFAPVALAHHPEISANQTCVDGKVTIAYESISWRTDGGSGSGHSNIVIEVQVNGAGSWTQVGSGSYTAGNNYRFSDTFDAESYWGESIQVQARAVGAWDNGMGGGETRTTSSFMVNQDCTDAVGVTANPQVCAVNQQGVPQGAVSFNVDPASGATIQVYANSNFTGPVGGPLEDDDVLNLAPGTYYWQATAAPGFDLGGTGSGQFSIAPCSASTVVVSGECAVNDNGAALGSVQVTIDPNSGATVVVSGPGGPYNFTGVGGSSELAPGSYSWQATAGPGFSLDGQTSGDFDIAPCEGSVTVTSDVCVLGDGPLGEVEVDIDPDSAALVTIYSDPAMTNAVAAFDDGGTADLAPGTYYWSASANGGFALSGETSGSFTIDPCVASVTVDPGVCSIDDSGTPVGSVQVTIDPESGATVVVSGPGGPFDFSGSGGSQGLAPGAYTWQATPGSGFVLTGDTNGGFNIEPCDVSVLVVSGACVVGDGPAGTVTVAIDETTGASVTVLDSESTTAAVFAGAGGSTALPPGVYTWQATPGPGFEFPDGQAASGEFTIEPCEGSVVVSHGNCVAGAATAFGSMTVVIDPASGAVVSVYNAGGLEVASFDGSGGSRALTAGNYTWTADAATGFGLVGESDGQFTVIACEDEVLDDEIVDDEVDDLVVLPFTGARTETLLGASIVLLGSGLLLIRSSRRRDEALDS
jgi:hypothetical protein